MRRPPAACALAVAAVAGLAPAGCHHRGTLDAARLLEESGGARLAPVSAADRREYLRRARIFEPVARPRDPLRGPPDAHGFTFLQHVGCDFVEPRRDRVPVGGTTPKFFCTLRRGRDHALVKIKYGRDDKETYGELLGSRLLWMLGVAVDRDWAVRVRCHGCPVEPWRAYRDFPAPDPTPRATREIDYAVLQRLYPGVPIEECVRAEAGRCVESRADEGWRFDELDLVDPAVGGAPRAEVDALRLLAAFIAHGDDKPSNQRLVCPYAAIDADGRCREPRLLVADLGSTFGRGAAAGLRPIDAASRPTFAAWSTLPLWDDPATCRAHLATRTAPPSPIVREAGRRFLAERLAALSERQIRNLFVAARIEGLGETSDGRPVTVDDWVAAFKRRRAAVVEQRCPE